MKVTWKHIFDLANKLWDLNQTDIANILEVDKSTISRLASGKTSKFSLRSKEIYEHLFNPTNPNSPAYIKNNASGNSEIVLLSTVKNIIKEEKWTDVLTESSNENYEDFMVKLIRQVQNNSTKPMTKKRDTSPDYNAANDHSVASDINSATVQKNSQNIDAEISIPPEYKKCFYCKCFNVPNQPFQDFFSNEDGICTLYRAKKASAELPCASFFPDNKKILNNMIGGDLYSCSKFPL